MSELPLRICFWRAAQTTCATRRCPLFDEDCGVTPSAAIANDELHVCALGNIQECCLVILWSVATLDIWGRGDLGVTTAVDSLNTQLQNWYVRDRHVSGHWGQGEINPLTVAVIGTREAPVLKAKGSESTRLFRFLYSEVLPRYVSQIPHGQKLAECCQALIEWYQLLHSMGDVPDANECTQLEQVCLRHLLLCPDAHIPYKPKHHYFFHLTFRILNSS